MPNPHDDAVPPLLAERFSTAGPAARRALQDAAVVRRYPDGAVVCTQGEHEDLFALVVDGRLDVYLDQPTGRTFVASLEAGRSLGGLEYVTRTARIADALAAGPVTLLELSFRDLDAAVSRDPEVLRVIAAEVVGELLESQDRFIHLSATSAPLAAEEVFVSYARTDVEFARQLTRDLRRRGVDVWLDVYDIGAGKSWARQVAEALDRCTAMVVVMSPASMASDNSDDEWNYYLDKKKPVLPVLYQPVDVPYRLNKLQYVDFVGQPRDRALTKLVVALRAALRAASDAPSGARTTAG